MSILVSPLSRVHDMAKLHAPSRVISLLDPESGFPSVHGYDDTLHLKLPVHDIAEDEHGMTAPCEKVVAKIIDFVADWDREAPLLIHCWAGISRSTATAFIAACMHNPSVDEAEIARALRASSPSATPNRRIVALADTALSRNGRMAAAVAGIGRGAPTWPEIEEATPFVLPSAFGTLRTS